MEQVCLQLEHLLPISLDAVSILSVASPFRAGLGFIQGHPGQMRLELKSGKDYLQGAILACFLPVLHPEAAAAD